MKTIILDAMGSDSRPNSEILGAIAALKEIDDITIVLVGDEKKIRPKLQGFPFDRKRLRLVHTAQEVEMSESPVKAMKEKKDSSMAVGLDLLKAGKGDAFISAGNTGAVMAHSLLQIGRIPGIQRPTIATTIPTLYGETLLVDAGANADCKASQLAQFAVMGDIYAKLVLGRKEPKIGLLSNGEEPEKGNELTKKAHLLIKKAAFLNFVGNVEGRDILSGDVDVVVCDGFTGNIVLKTVESLFKFLYRVFKHEISKHFLAKIGILFLIPSLKKLMKKMDYTEYGTAPLLGIRKPIMVCHGSSNQKAIKNAVLFTYRYLQKDFNKTLSAEIDKLKGI
ncbi:MAG TPA: phosphate acyltransferase PlsX [Candidatus Mcinerneyibacteriales bacterium]|nr:phosphate acyltransferase PlsX [Candidatus Mcinerneyibacteriales bacterium]